MSVPFRRRTPRRATSRGIPVGRAAGRTRPRRDEVVINLAVVCSRPRGNNYDVKLRPNVRTPEGGAKIDEMRNSDRRCEAPEGGAKTDKTRDSDRRCEAPEGGAMITSRDMYRSCHNARGQPRIA